MCAADSDGRSHKFKSGPKFCFMTANNTVVEMPLRIQNFTRTITDFAVDFIATEAALRAKANSRLPFFFFMAYFHVHTPLFTQPKNTGRSRGGRFGDNVEELDDSVGRLMTALEEGGFTNNTLIFFTSDNGPYAEEGWDNSGRTNVYDRSRSRQGRLKGSKGQNWEGGLRMPGAVVWPGVAPPNSVSDVLVSSMDIFATALAAAGAAGNASGNLVESIDGRDLTPLLRGNAPASQHAVLLHFCGFTPTAARVGGRWKLHWAIQRWYTNDAKNGSICLQCCNGVNSYSKLVAPASELCGCEARDMTWLPQPIVFDMSTDKRELVPLNASNWPPLDVKDDVTMTYDDVVAAAVKARGRVLSAAGHPSPDRDGAGTCTAGFPAGSRQPCCPGCHAHTLLGSCVDEDLKACSCG